MKKLRRLAIADEATANTFLETTYWPPHNARFPQGAGGDRGRSSPLSVGHDVDPDRWTLPERGRKERAHRSLENTERFPRASTGVLTSVHRGHFYRVNARDISNEL